MYCLSDCYGYWCKVRHHITLKNAAICVNLPCNLLHIAVYSDAENSVFCIKWQHFMTWIAGWMHWFHEIIPFSLHFHFYLVQFFSHRFWPIILTKRELFLILEVFWESVNDDGTCKHLRVHMHQKTRIIAWGYSIQKPYLPL